MLLTDRVISKKINLLKSNNEIPNSSACDLNNVTPLIYNIFSCHQLPQLSIIITGNSLDANFCSIEPPSSDLIVN